MLALHRQGKQMQQLSCKLASKLSAAAKRVGGTDALLIQPNLSSDELAHGLALTFSWS